MVTNLVDDDTNEIMMKILMAVTSSEIMVVTSSEIMIKNLVLLVNLNEINDEKSF